MERPVIQSVSTIEDKCQINWNDGQTCEFHPLWLRDNCPCPSCLHPTTRERILDIMDIPFDIGMPENIKTSSDGLYMQWPDGHESQYSTEWLRQHSYSDQARNARKPNPVLWDADILSNLPEIEYEDVMAEDAGMLRWLDMMMDYGFALIRNTPTRDGEVVKVAQRISYLRETNFGRDFSVISKANPNNVAYTALALHSHTDLPNWQLPPGTQFLHCLKFEAEGGESTLVDGFKVARELQEKSPDAFDILSSQSIPFRFHDEGWDISWSAPTITCDIENTLKEIRYHAALTAPLDIPSDNVMPFYKAYRALTDIVRSDKNILKIKLAPGDLLVFDNSRALHGRMAFDPASGERHLQGCYVDNDAIRSKRQVLQQKLKGKIS